MALFVGSRLRASFLTDQDGVEYGGSIQRTAGGYTFSALTAGTESYWEQPWTDLI